MPRALLLLCPAAHVAVVNAACANLGLGPSMLSAKLCPSDSQTPDVATHYGSHWNAAPDAITATLEQMISGIIPTEYVDEFDQPATCQWGVNGIPTEAAVLTAMATVTRKIKPYDSPESYNVSAEWAAFIQPDDLVPVVEED